jgi:hypothetical protein
VPSKIELIVNNTISQTTLIDTILSCSTWTFEGDNIKLPEIVIK